MGEDLKHSKKPEKAPVIIAGSGNGTVPFLIGLLTVLAFWGVHRTFPMNKTTAAVMNIVGKQRMLIQRVYMLCEASLIGDWYAVASQYQKERDAKAEKRELVETSLSGGILALLLASDLFAFWSLARMRRKEAEPELNRFFNLPLDMMCIVWKDGYFKKVNQAFIKTMGYSEGELLERPYIELIHPDDRQPTINEQERLLKVGGATQDFENRYECKDGTYRWFSWKAVAVSEEGCLYAPSVTSRSARALRNPTNSRRNIWSCSGKLLLPATRPAPQTTSCGCS